MKSRKPRQDRQKNGRKMREELILLAIVEILLGGLALLFNSMSEVLGGSGNIFKVYVACACVFNVVVALHS